MRVQGIVTLARKHGRDARSPDCLHVREYTELVVDQHTMLQPIGKRIMNQEMRDRQQMQIAGVLRAIPLKSP